MEQSVLKRRHIKFGRRGITQKKTYNTQNTAKVWNQEGYVSCIILKSWSKPASSTKFGVLSAVNTLGYLLFIIIYWEELIKCRICPYLIYNGRVGVLCLW